MDELEDHYYPAAFPDLNLIYYVSTANEFLAQLKYLSEILLGCLEVSGFANNILGSILTTNVHRLKDAMSLSSI